MSERLDWERLRQDVDDVQRSVVHDAELLRRERARFLLAMRGVPRRPKRPRPARAWMALAAAALVLLGLGVTGWLRLRVPAALTFRPERGGHDVEVGTSLAPPAGQALPLRFSDGTRISVEPAARARVTKTRAHGADVVLEQGRLRLAVVHEPESDWHVNAGPFTVSVTGTHFDVGWAPSERTFSLALHEGSVKVLGPTLGTGGRLLKAGETLRIEMADATPSLTSAALPRSAVTDATTPAAPAPSASGQPSPRKPGKPETPEAWRELAQKARYADALAAADAAGFDAIARSASAKDLVLLGNSARFAGASARAEQAFRLLRSRFGKTPEAAMAAFFLGRIAYDQKGDRREAADWFQSYLREEPHGGLAREAAGRLLEAQKASGDVTAARASARSYLEKYPSGPHAGLARSVLGE